MTTTIVKCINRVHQMTFSLWGICKHLLKRHKQKSMKTMSVRIAISIILGTWCTSSRNCLNCPVKRIFAIKIVLMKYWSNIFACIVVNTKLIHIVKSGMAGKENMACALKWTKNATCSAYSMYYLFLPTLPKLQRTLVRLRPKTHSKQVWFCAYLPSKMWHNL